MAKIKTFELDRWSEPDEKRRVRHIGMADTKETFDRLQTHLELKGLLPDEYFLFSDELTGELPEFDQALCIPNFGASEGIYLDISLACRDKDGKRCFQNFATGKTLGETADDYYRMFRIAAECSLMLNGRGNTYEQKKVDIVLTEQEAEAVGTVVDMELCGHHPPEAEAILNSALEKIDRIAFAKVQTITCHGKDDYSFWSAEIPKDIVSRAPQSLLIPETINFETYYTRRIDLKESPIKTERKTLHLPEDTVRALNKLAAKNGTDFSKEVRRAIDEYLDLETTAENIDMINGVIRQELSGQLKALGNRLAGLINRLTIISAAGYYANIAIIADLIDQDRYSSFEKIESAARKRALAFANQKNADALRTFMDDEEMQKAIHAVQGGSRVDSDL